MTIQQAIEKAMDAGYKHEAIDTLLTNAETGDLVDDMDNYIVANILLDPLFWQSLGKSMGWKDKYGHEFTPGGMRVRIFYGYGWQDKWHQFIDHLAEGKDAESFFESL